MSELNNEREIERLLKTSGERVKPPEDMRARVYDDVLAEWEQLPAAPSVNNVSSRRPWTGLLAAAAGVLLVGLVWFYRAPAPTPVEPRTAAVVHHTKAYAIDGVQIAKPAPLLPGQRLATVRGYVHLTLVTGLTVTLAPDTQLTYETPDRFSVHGGRIFVDAGADDQKVWIRTPHAEITDTGTQFDIAVEGDELIVAVREGAIDIHLDAQVIQAIAADGIGERLTFAGRQLDHTDQLTASDDWWNWRQAGRPAYILDGSTVFDYVSWMARDRGHHIEFGSRAVEARAKGSKLEGFGANWTSDNTEFTDALAATGFIVKDLGAYTWEVDFAGK